MISDIKRIFYLILFLFISIIIRFSFSLKLLIRFFVSTHNKIIKKKKSLIGIVVKSITFRNIKMGIGGSGGVLYIQSEILKNIINTNYLNRIYFSLSYAFKKNENRYSKNIKSQLYDLFGAIHFVFKECRYDFDTVYVAHDYACAFALHLLKRKYVYIHHLQGSRVEEKKAFGDPISWVTNKIICYCEKKAFKNAVSVYFPSYGAIDMFLESKYTIVKKEDFVLGGVLYNTILSTNNITPLEGIQRDDDYITFLSVSSLTMIKGVDRCIDFLRHYMTKQSKKVRYILVGFGVMYNDIINLLNQLQDTYDNFSYVHYNHLSQDQVSYLHSITDVYLMLHRKSIFDLSTLESMSHKKAIVLSNVGGNIDFNKENNICMLIDDNYDDLVDKLLIADLKQLGENNYKIYDLYFSNEVFSMSYIEVFNKLASIYKLRHLNEHNASFLCDLVKSIFSRYPNDNLLVKEFEKNKFFSYLINYKGLSINVKESSIIYLQYLIKHGLIKKAEKYLKRYIKKFGLSEVEKSLYVSSLALSMNFRNDEIEKNVYICNELNKQMENNSLYNLIKDKKIAIVGSSDECMGKNLGDEIDGHDLVVRFNHYEINGYENDYGKRVDIHCVNLSNNNKISDDVTTLAVITGVPFNYFFNTGMKKFSDFNDFINGNLGTRKSLYNCPPLYDLARNYKIFIPTSGLIFIYHVYQLLGNLNNVKIYGFDFLKDKPSYSLNHYYDNLDNSKGVYWGGHDVKMEGKLLNYLYKKN